MIAQNPTRTADKQSIAVIGAGPGGLAAAMLLASSGLKVHIYEAQPQVGGRTGRLTLDNYHFDRGPTFFLMPYVLEEIFAAAGRSLSDYVDLRRLDPMYRLIVGDPSGKSPTILDATQNISEMARRISAINPADGRAFERFIADNRAKLRAAEPILRRPIRSPADLMAPDAIRALPHIKPHLSVHQLLSKYFRHPAVQLAVSFQSKYLGMSPYDCPSLFTILPFIEYEWGIWHPIGGCHALMQAMADACLEMGVEIHLASPVEAITFQGKRATGVRVGAQDHTHSHVVVNADAAWAIKNLIPQQLRPTSLSDQSMDAKKYSCSTYMMYLGVDGEVDLSHHSIYISSKYKNNLDDISKHGRLSDDPSIYLCNPSRIDPTLAPDGKSSLYVLMPTPNCTSHIDWQHERERLRNACFDQMESRLGLTGIRNRIEQSQDFTPSDWAGMNINFGATFNLAHNLAQMLHKRPHHRLQGFDSLWLVGGGTHPGSGLPVIFLSSQITARMLCEEVGVPYSGDQPARPRITPVIAEPSLSPA